MRGDASALPVPSPQAEPEAMKNGYEVNLERDRAQQAMREAHRLTKVARGWRERVLSADEKVEYERLEAAAGHPPRSLGHRAALPAYLLSVLWGAVIVLLALPMMTKSAQFLLFPEPTTQLVVLLIVMFGGMVGVVWLLVRRTKIAVKVFEDACARAVRDYLDDIGYEERRREAEQKDREDADFWGSFRLGRGGGRNQYRSR